MKRDSQHNIPVTNLHKDVVQLWAASKTAYTHRGLIDSRSRHRTMVPLKEYENSHILVSKDAEKLEDAGIKVNLGAHGQIQGIGTVWELWMLAQGGMTNMEAFQAANINGAQLGNGRSDRNAKRRNVGRFDRFGQKSIGGNSKLQLGKTHHVERKTVRYENHGRNWKLREPQKSLLLGDERLCPGV